MEALGVRIVPNKPQGAQRSLIWFLCLAFFTIFLFQISVPVVIYCQLSDIHDGMSANATALSGNEDLYVVSVRQVFENNIAVLTCWGGSFLFLVALMLLGCIKLKNLMVLAHSRPPACHPEDYVEEILKRRAKFEADNVFKRKAKVEQMLRMPAEKHDQHN